MKFLKSSFVALAVIGLLSGCSSTGDKEKIEKIKKVKAGLAIISAEEKADAKKFAESQAEMYYNAIKNKDYNALSKIEEMSREKFDKWYDKVSKTYGKLESQKYVGCITNPLIIRYIWKWTFTKKINGKDVSYETICNIFVAKDKSKNKYFPFNVVLQ